MKMKIRPLILAAIAAAAIGLINAAPAKAGCEARLSAGEPNARINVRDGAGTQYFARHYGLPGERVEIIITNTTYTVAKDRYGYQWYKVRFPKTGAVGWIREDFLTKFAC
jgi:hypothetical protein